MIIYIDYCCGKFHAWSNDDKAHSHLAAHTDENECIRLATLNSGLKPSEIELTFTGEARYARLQLANKVLR
jgi:hypothetical protein